MASPAPTIQAPEVLDLLTRLVEKSLVVYDESTGRYGLLETVRQYAGERLREGGEEGVARTRHRGWCLRLAEEAEPNFRGPEAAPWMDRLETEHDNLRSALEGCLAEEDEEPGLRLAGALWRFWRMRGYLDEGRAHLMVALARGQTPPSRTLARAGALAGAGIMAFWQGDIATAKPLLEESLKVARDLEDRPATCLALSSLASVAQSQGDFEGARALFEESLSIRRALGDRKGIATNLLNLGDLAINQRDLVAARPLFEEGLALSRELGDKGNVAIALGNLGQVAFAEGDATTAHACYRERLMLSRDLGHKEGAAYALEGLAAITREAAATPERSVRLYGAAAALRESIGVPPQAYEREQRDATLAALRTDLGDDAFDAVFAAGQALSWEQAIEDALSGEEA